MQFPEGSRLGPYEILSAIGAGGMGEVYRARDTRLDRIVAIKVLPANTSGDPEFRQRFEREARAISALDHPNICALHDVGTHTDGAAYLVMQYLEGETLAARLARSGKPASNPTMSGAASFPADPAPATAVPRRGLLPVEHVLRFARDIALGLSAAHHRGIVHRDLKPGNVMLTKTSASRPGSGQVKLLDFGLAKLTVSPGDVPGSKDPGLRNATGETRLGAAPLTSQGSLLGTLPYMSPEQVEGNDVDARSDLFSLGAICYEMIIGRRPFDSPSQAGLVAAILTSDPPVLAQLTEVRAEIAPATRRALDRLLKKSLAKAPDERWQCAADLAAELKSIDEDRVRGPQEDPGPVAAAPPAATSRLKQIAPWAIAATAVVVAAIVTLNRPTAASATPSGPIWSTINLQGIGLVSDGNDMVAVSPDGRQIALGVEGDGRNGIAIRTLSSPDMRLLGGTLGANHLFWAPDGKSLGFFTDDALKKVDVASGTVQTICAVTFGSGGAWNAEGTIIYSTDLLPLHRTSVSGAASAGCGSPIVGADVTIQTHPYFLPDGRHFVAASDEQAWLGSLDGGWTAKLADTGRAEAVFAAPDWLLTKATASEVQARRIDVVARSLTGDPKTVLPWIGNPGGHTGVSASATGVLVTQLRNSLAAGRRRAGTETAGGRHPSLIFDRDASTNRAVAIANGWAGRRLSRDGTRFALGAWNLYVVDASTGKGARVGGSVESGRDVSASPVWGPRDATVAYLRRQSTGSEGAAKIEVVDLASGEIKTLFDSPPDAVGLILTDWSKDGDAIAFVRAPVSAPATREAWEYDVRTAKTRRLFDAAGDETEMQYAPAGGWVAYTATVSGESDVFLRPRSGEGAAVRVSSGGGRLPRWRADGGELLYIGADDAVMAVPVTWHPAPTIGVAKVAQAASALEGRRITSFDPAPDGRRFHLGLRSEIPGLTLILDWWALLR